MYRVQLKVRDATKASRTDKHIIISVLSENDSITDSAKHWRIAQSSLMGCNRWKKQYMCHDGVSEMLSALGVVLVNTLHSTVWRKQTSHSLASSRCPCYLYKSLVFLCLIATCGVLRINLCPLKNQQRDPPFCLESDSGFQENQRYILCCEKHHYSLPDGDGFLRPLFIVSPKKNMKLFWNNYRIDFFSFKKSSHWQKWWHVPLGINSTVEQSKIFPHFWLNSLGCYFQCTANILKKSF